MLIKRRGCQNDEKQDAAHGLTSPAIQCVRIVEVSNESHEKHKSRSNDTRTLAEIQRVAAPSTSYSFISIQG